MHEALTLQSLEIGSLVSMVQQGRLGEAEKEARQLLSRHPTAGMLWKILSIALLRQGKDALPALHRATDLMPNDAEAHRNLGGALRERGMLDAASQSFGRAVALSPRDPDLLLDLADTLREAGKVRDSLPHYLHALRVDPRQVEARNNLGNAYLELKQYSEAAACFRQALTVRPRDALIHCNLAMAERLMGRLEIALESAARAAALGPGLAAAHNQLGIVQAAMGRREAAVASFSQALFLSPEDVDGMNSLGKVLREIGRWREALALHRRAIELNPGRVDSLWNLGSALFEQRQTQEASDSFRRALAVDPNHAPAHLSLGLTLRQQRQPEQAMASCRAALAIDPSYVEALTFLGELEADRGRFSDAEMLFQRAIGIDPRCSMAYFSLATHRKMTVQDTAWLEGVKSSLGKNPALGDQINLHYALGKYYDDVGRYSEAFADYRQANELSKRYGVGFDRKKLTAFVDELVHAFDREFIERLRDERRPYDSPPGQVSGSRVPVLIVGMPRSGTSLAEQVLASHPEVFGAGELTFWNGAFAAYREAAAREATGAAAALARSAAEYLDLLAAMSQGAPRVIDKMPANFFHLGVIHAAFPNARIIHMSRHPVDTCLSIYFQNFFSMGPYANDLEDLAHYYGEYARLIDHWRTVLPSDVFLDVPYESMVEDSEQWIRRMVSFIGLEWDPRCLESHRTDRLVLTASRWQVRQKIHAASAGRWTHYQEFVGPLLAVMQSSRSQH